MHAAQHLPLKPVVLEILLALAAGPLHGYAILRSVRDRTGGVPRLETGPLYRHLARLLDGGLVEETAAPKEPDTYDERRRYYRLTELGREVLRLEGERLLGLVEATRRLGIAGAGE